MKKAMLTREVCKERLKMKFILREQNISRDTYHEIALLFKPMETDLPREQLAKKISEFLNEKITEEELIRKATEYQKKLLDKNN